MAYKTSIMKIKLTEKFSIKRKGHVIDVSDVTAQELIQEGKATAVAVKTSKGKEKAEEPKEESKEEPQTDVKGVVIE